MSAEQEKEMSPREPAGLLVLDIMAACKGSVELVGVPGTWGGDLHCVLMREAFRKSLRMHVGHEHGMLQGRGHTAFWK